MITDVDECEASGTCGSADCINIVGDYYCTCRYQEGRFDTASLSCRCKYAKLQGSSRQTTELYAQHYRAPCSKPHVAICHRISLPVTICQISLAPMLPFILQLMERVASLALMARMVREVIPAIMTLLTLSVTVESVNVPMGMSSAADSASVSLKTL